ncbi:MAG TPA: PTS system mannose/fructose/sorbose family transporter subunit IID [Candidatus Mcinerneyibacteriales bacterium]|nr:PTS system mannose/fructose/sorbose family transporter subunit IID [Candidatus Mcinerneyibacteriales bacterium]
MGFIMTFIRTFFIQALWNYDKMMNSGFFFALKPRLEKFAGIQREREVRRFNTYFNTHPFMASFIIGAVMRLEEEYYETGNEELATEIENIKLKLMGPLAALGDSLFWGGLKPFFILCSVFFLFFAPSLSWALTGLFLYWSGYNTIHLSFRYRGLTVGYRYGRSLIVFLKKLEIQKKVDFLRRTAIILLGVFWGLGITWLFSEGLEYGWPFLLSSLFIILLVRRMPNILIVGLTMIILLLGGRLC